MPELPEVHTIVSELNKVLPGLKIADVWTDWKKMIKNPKNFEDFKKELVAKKILNLSRRGKNILINLSANKTLIIHQKLTGHLLYGKWRLDKGMWRSEIKGPLSDDPQNNYLHLVLSFSNGYQLGLSDVRKFAKVLIWSTDNLENLRDLKELGPDPMQNHLDFEQFSELIAKRKKKIKIVLMDQTVISGIGNIYSDEILWEAGVNPLKIANELNNEELKKILMAIPKILNRAIEAKGSSNVDYRLPSGKMGRYQKLQKAYRQEGEKCAKKDGGVIKKIKINGRSGHYCPVHQKL